MNLVCLLANGLVWRYNFLGDDMISRDDIIKFAVALGGVVDKPFTEDFDTTVLRHSDTSKWFGILLKAPCGKLDVKGLKGEQTDVINLKCDPALSFGLINRFNGIIPAYHMNKYHWISVVLDSDVPFEELKPLISLSFSLTEKKK